MTGERMKETMARLFTTEQAKQEATQEPEKKKRRRSLVDHDPLPEPGTVPPKKKRTRRKKNPELKKSYSMTVLMTPELHRRLKRIAEQEELSMNGIVTRLIRKYVITHDIDMEDIEL